MSAPIVRPLISQNNQLWENTESKAYLRTLAHQKTRLERQEQINYRSGRLEFLENIFLTPDLENRLLIHFLGNQEFKISYLEIYLENLEISRDISRIIDRSNVVYM